MRIPIMFAALMLAMLAGVAAAQTVPAPPTDGDPRPFGQRPATATLVAEPLALMIAGCDGNGDARVDRAELSACLSTTFSPYLKGGMSTGYIGYADWALRWMGNATALPSPFEIDTDRDNQITLAELQARFADIFMRLDTDKDDAISRAELLSIRGNAGGFDRRRRNR